MATPPPQSATLLGIPLDVRLIVFRYNLPLWSRVTRRIREEIQKYIFSPNITADEIIRYLVISRRGRFRYLTFINPTQREILQIEMPGYSGKFIIHGDPQVVDGIFPPTSPPPTNLPYNSRQREFTISDIRNLYNGGYSFLSVSSIYYLYSERRYLPLHHLREAYKIFNERYPNKIDIEKLDLSRDIIGDVGNSIRSGKMRIPTEKLSSGRIII